MSDERLRRRFQIADGLNRLKRSCWADLVGWIYHEKTGDRDVDAGYRLRSSLSGGRSCREESTTHRDLTCYCGKFTNGCLTAKGQTPGVLPAESTTNGGTP